MLSTLLDKWFKDTPGNDVFAERFIATARRIGVTKPMTYDAALFRVQVGQGSYFNLHNAHHAYLSAGRGAQQQALDIFVRGLQAIDGSNDSAQSWEQVRPLLRPIIRNLAQLEHIRLSSIETLGWDTPNTLQYRRLTDECVELLAIDHAEHMVTKQDGPPPEWEITLDGALDEARRNLRAIDPVDFAPIAPGLYRAAWADCYDSSRALLPELVNRVPVAGRPVFLLAARDVMLVAGENDTDAQGLMFDIAQEEIQAGRTISWELLSHDDDGRITAREPATAALRLKQDQLRRSFRQDAYQQQKELLQRVHEAHDVDVFVATFMVYRSDTETFSIASWAQGVEASLPRTDYLAFVVPDDDSRVIRAPWNTAMPIVGHLLEADPRHLHPPRFLTRGFPTGEQLAQLEGR
jgi:hypothetical protein